MRHAVIIHREPDYAAGELDAVGPHYAPIYSGTYVPRAYAAYARYGYSPCKLPSRAVRHGFECHCHACSQ